MIKKLGILAVCTTLLFSRAAFAAEPSVDVWAYNSADAAYVSAVAATIETHVPQSTIAAFNAHDGQVVISTSSCDPFGIAGMTNGIPTKSGWYTWDKGNTYIDLTPSYGLYVMQGTTLHEFGHVFDMQTRATDDPSVVAMLDSELPAYTALEANTGYMIPSIKNSHELFAQVFAAVVSNNDGTVNNSAEIIAECPKTASYIQDLISKN